MERGRRLKFLLNTHAFIWWGTKNPKLSPRATPAHAEKAGYLDRKHKDPFDRLLIAQALIEGLVIISNETLFDQFGLPRLW